MLRPKSMERVLLVGSKERLEEVLETIRELRVLHLEEFTGTEKGKPLEGSEEISEKLISLRSVLSRLSEEIRQVYSELNPIHKITEEEIEKKEKEILNIISRLQSLLEERDKTKSTLNDKKSEINLLRILESLDIRLDVFHEYETIDYKVGVTQTELNKEMLKSELNSDEFEIFTGFHDGKNILAIFYRKELSKSVERLLDRFGFSELEEIYKITKKYRSGHPSEIMSSLEMELHEIKENASRLEDEILSILRENLFRILAYEEYLKAKSMVKEAPLWVGVTKETFLLEGWVPSDSIDSLSSLKDIFFTKIEEDENSEPPTLLENPQLIKPFEALVNSYSVPRYHEIDPSSLIFVTFPLFYGLMLGDVGYGMLLLILTSSGILKSFLEKLGFGSSSRVISKILLVSSVWTIIFGYVYNEFFGFEILRNILPYPSFLPVHRLGKEGIKELFLITVTIGIAHLYLGLIMGFRNKAIEEGLRKAIHEKGGWLLILTGMTVLVYGLILPMVTGSQGISGSMELFVLLIISGSFLLVSGGLGIEIVEIPSILSNILSYTRLMAIGISSAVIAVSFNEMGIESILSGNEILGGLILLSGHSINLALGIIGPGLHSLRLQYVEFFTKFYLGGGRRFSPFGLERKYTIPRR